MRVLIISAIVLVAVIMGIGTISPMIPQAEARHGGPELSDRACEALTSIPNPSAAVVELIRDHCVGGCDPSVPPGCPTGAKDTIS